MKNQTLGKSLNTKKDHEVEDISSSRKLCNLVDTMKRFGKLIPWSVEYKRIKKHFGKFVKLRK